MNVSNNLTASLNVYGQQAIQQPNQPAPSLESRASVAADSVEISAEALVLAEQTSLKFGPGNPPPIDP